MNPAIPFRAHQTHPQKVIGYRGPEEPVWEQIHRVENIDDPLMQKIRYLDKLVDELAKGKAMEKILR